MGKTLWPGHRHPMCVQIGNRLFAELRIADCVRAGETAPIQLLSSPERVSCFKWDSDQRLFWGGWMG